MLGLVVPIVGIFLMTLLSDVAYVFDDLFACWELGGRFYAVNNHPLGFYEGPMVSS